jgi:hypothetical protein
VRRWEQSGEGTNTRLHLVRGFSLSHCLWSVYVIIMDLEVVEGYSIVLNEYVYYGGKDESREKSSDALIR